jgi:class 3 adenylate cyclase
VQSMTFADRNRSRRRGAPAGANQRVADGASNSSTSTSQVVSRRRVTSATRSSGHGRSAACCGHRVDPACACQAGRRLKALPDVTSCHYATPTLVAGIVTYLLTDIERSTRQWEANPRAMLAVVRRHDSLLAGAIGEHAGVVLTERGEGDSFLAIFARASRAIEAAAAIQEAIATEDWSRGIEIRVRVAIHAGETESDYRGPTVSRCARLRELASGGQVLVSGTAALIARDHLPEGLRLTDLGPHRLRDLPEPERIHRLEQLVDSR